MGRAIFFSDCVVPCFTVKMTVTIQSGVFCVFVVVVLFFGVFFWLHGAARKILVPPPGTEPVPSAVEAWSINHWTAREVPEGVFFFLKTWQNYRMATLCWPFPHLFLSYLFVLNY